MTILRTGSNEHTRVSAFTSLASQQMARRGFAPCQTICQPYSAQPGTPCGCKCMMYCAGK